MSSLEFDRPCFVVRITRVGADQDGDIPRIERKREPSGHAFFDRFSDRQWKCAVQRRKGFCVVCRTFFGSVAGIMEARFGRCHEMVTENWIGGAKKCIVGSRSGLDDPTSNSTRAKCSGVMSGVNDCRGCFRLMETNEDEA